MFSRLKFFKMFALQIATKNKIVMRLGFTVRLRLTGFGALNCQRCLSNHSFELDIYIVCIINSRRTDTVRKMHCLLIQEKEEIIELKVTLINRFFLLYIYVLFSSTTAAAAARKQQFHKRREQANEREREKIT